MKLSHEIAIIAALAIALLVGRMGKTDVRVEEGMAKERVEREARRPLADPLTGRVPDRRLCPGEWIEHSPPRAIYCVKASPR